MIRTAISISVPSMFSVRRSQRRAASCITGSTLRRVGIQLGLLLRRLAEQVVVEDDARDRRRGAAAVPAVFDQDPERDARVLGRRERDEERVIAESLGDLLLVVLLALLHRDDLR